MNTTDTQSDAATEPAAKNAPMVLDLGEYGGDTETVEVETTDPKGNTYELTVEFVPGNVNAKVISSWRRMEMLSKRRPGQAKASNIESTEVQLDLAIDIIEAVVKNTGIIRPDGTAIEPVREDLVLVPVPVLMDIAAALVSPGEG